jgi:hypothetical protein
MLIIFYYPKYDYQAINGTQDVIKLIIKELKVRGHTSIMCGEGSLLTGDISYKQINMADLFVVITSSEGINLNAITIPMILWNHCWDFVEGVDKHLSKFEKIVARSEKHAKNLGVEDWCYGGYDPTIFYQDNNTKRDLVSVVYCGGDKWWKGARQTTKIKELLKTSSIKFSFENVYELSQMELSAKFRKTAIVIIPSAIESFSLVSIQAQACGCLPVANNCGGISETICDEMKDICLYNEYTELAAVNKIVEARREFSLEMQSSMNEHIQKFKSENIINMFLSIIDF